MPDYIYLLENRLSADQQNAIRSLREAAREAGTILFLTGDAVRDLTSGHAVRDLEVADARERGDGEQGSGHSADGTSSTGCPARRSHAIDKPEAWRSSRSTCSARCVAL